MSIVWRWWSANIMRLEIGPTELELMKPLFYARCGVRILAVHIENSMAIL
jgi:hypothetical protein